MPLAPGTRIGRYEIRSLLGQGGMGEVYRANDTSLGRDVALKVLDPSVAVDPERVHRFLQEARAASALNHPNIIAIHEAGESDGVRFIASELVEGRTLREVIETGPLPAADALEIAVQVASALAAAHAAGIVHRDIKPENVMVRPDGYAKVLDFGLAKLTDPSASGAHPSPDAAATMLQTTAGVIMGTVAYMSPEQARALKVDARSDCYSLGAVIFEMLTGRQPFTGATGTDVMVAILERDAPLDVLRREGLPPQLVWVLAKALEKNPDVRHQTAADLRVDLERLRRDIATGATYADHDYGGERPSAILRDVSDTDPDAIRMYGWSKGTLAAAVAGVVVLLALPFLYRATLGSEQKAVVAEAAAEIRARDISAALGRPVDGRKARISLERSGLSLYAVRNVGLDDARRAVREGQAARWDVNFNGEATDESPGASTITLTPDGRLRSFTIQPRRKRVPVTMSRDEATRRAADAARQHLAIDVAAFALEHAWLAADGTSYDIEWKNPEPVFGHTELVRAVLDDTGLTALSRRLEYERPKRAEIGERLNSVRAVVMIFGLAGIYVFGILVLVRSRRWTLVSRSLPIALSACLAAGFVFAAAADEGGVLGRLALASMGVLLAGGALPSLAGLVVWLKQSSAVRMHGAEQLAAGHFRSPAAASSLLTGAAAGAAIGAIMLAYSAIGLRVPGFDPSVSREIGLASPDFYNTLGSWLGAAAGLSLAVAMLYELPHRLLTRPLPAVAAIVILAGLVSGDVRAWGLPLAISIAAAMAIITVLIVAYARRGLGAVFVAVMMWPAMSDLVAAWSIGGSEAGPRATMLLVLLLAVIGLAAWSYAGDRMKAGVDTLSAKSGIR